MPIWSTVWLRCCGVNRGSQEIGPPAVAQMIAAPKADHALGVVIGDATEVATFIGVRAEEAEVAAGTWRIRRRTTRCDVVDPPHCDVQFNACTCRAQIAFVRFCVIDACECSGPRHDI